MRRGLLPREGDRGPPPPDRAIPPRRDPVQFNGRRAGRARARARARRRGDGDARGAQAARLGVGELAAAVELCRVHRGGAEGGGADEGGRGARSVQGVGRGREEADGEEAGGQEGAS